MFPVSSVIQSWSSQSSPYKKACKHWGWGICGTWPNCPAASGYLQLSGRSLVQKFKACHVGSKNYAPSKAHFLRASVARGQGPLSLKVSRYEVRISTFKKHQHHATSLRIDYSAKGSGQQQSLLANQSFEENEFCPKHSLKGSYCLSLGNLIIQHQAIVAIRDPFLDLSILHCHMHFYWMKWCEGHTHCKIDALTLVLWQSVGTSMMFQSVPMAASQKSVEIPNIAFAGF